MAIFDLFRLPGYISTSEYESPSPDLQVGAFDAQLGPVVEKFRTISIFNLSSGTTFGDPGFWHHNKIDVSIYTVIYIGIRRMSFPSIYPPPCPCGTKWNVPKALKDPWTLLDVWTSGLEIPKELLGARTPAEARNLRYHFFMFFS